MLEKQLNQSLLRENQSIERESFYQEQIEAMQRLLEAPPPHMTTFTDQKPVQSSMAKTDPEQGTIEPKHDGLTTPEQTENHRISVPEHVEPEQTKRVWLSRFFLPNG
jgi:hypothetical protein